MRAVCPRCSRAVEIPDASVPEAGGIMDCPTCSHRFPVRPPLSRLMDANILPTAMDLPSQPRGPESGSTDGPSAPSFPPPQAPFSRPAASPEQARSTHPPRTGPRPEPSRATSLSKNAGRDMNRRWKFSRFLGLSAFLVIFCVMVVGGATLLYNSGVVEDVHIRQAVSIVSNDEEDVIQAVERIKLYGAKFQSLKLRGEEEGFWSRDNYDEHVEILPDGRKVRVLTRTGDDLKTTEPPAQEEENDN